MKTSVKFETIFPLTTAPLIQCITNEITCESMANALLYIDAKPIMADDSGISAVVSANQCFGFEFRPFITRTRAKLVSASDYARQ